jgi:transposase
MHLGWYDRSRRRGRDLSGGAYRIYLEVEVRRVVCRSCAAVTRERLSFLADRALQTKRFAYYVGRRCRSATIKDLAAEWHLGWDSVKELDKQDLRAQLAWAGTPGPKGIGGDEISIRKGQTERIVVSDLMRGRPLWFGGEDRCEAIRRVAGPEEERSDSPGAAGHGAAVSQCHDPARTPSGASF